jgi:hypothetical protein
MGFRQKPLTIDIPDLNDTTSVTAKTETMDVLVIWREHLAESPVALQSTLADTDCHPGSGDAVVNTSTGFLEVEEAESVVVLSKIVNDEGK